MGARHDIIPINYLNLSNKIRYKIKATNKSRPNKKLGTESRYLSLSKFLASHKAEGFHWTMHKTTSKI